MKSEQPFRFILLIDNKNPDQGRVQFLKKSPILVRTFKSYLNLACSVPKIFQKINF